MGNSEFDEQWLARLQAVGKVQERYVWLLFLSCLFYGSLDSSVESIEVPIVGLELLASTVRASGPAVISFIVLTFTGALRASGTATRELGLKRVDCRAEKLDLHPNSIDLAFYTSKRSARWLAAVTHFKYPVFFSLALFVALWVLLQSYQGASVRGSVLAGLGGLLWLLAIIQVGQVWISRFRTVATVVSGDA